MAAPYKKVALALLLYLLFISQAGARDLAYQYRESLVRTAFLYNIAKFVTWPASSFRAENSPLLLTVLDPTIDDAALQTIAGRQVRGRPLQIRSISTIRQIKQPHILFIGEAFTEDIDAVLKSLDGKAVLSISGKEGFVESGGAIELFTRDKQLRFAVNLQTIRDSGLILSSEVIRLASAVRRVEGGGQ